MLHPDLHLWLLQQDQARRDARLERLAHWAETGERRSRRRPRRR